MDWRDLISDVNLIWTTLGVALAGLGTAFFAGRWIGRADIQTLRALGREREGEIAAKNREIAELKEQGRSKVPQSAPAFGGMPPESVQVWLKEVSAEDSELARRDRIPTLAIANLKGGVAKTMLAANLAAYFSKRASYTNTRHQRDRRVLLIDLDYQGSLSSMVLTASGVVPDHPSSQVKTLFDYAFSDDDAFNYRVRPSVALPSLSLYPATYGFDDLETREQFLWLAGETSDDIRFRLLKRLLAPRFREAFDLVVLDTGPRLTTGSVAALAAATHLLVPTSANRRDLEAAERFLRRVSVLKDHGLCAGLNVLGAVLALSQGGAGGVHRANAALESLQATVDADANLRSLFAQEKVFLDSVLPRSQPIVDQAEASLPYLATTASRAIFNDIGAEIEKRMF